MITNSGLDNQSSLLSLNFIPAKSHPFQSVAAHAYITGIVAQALYDLHLSTGTKQKLTDALHMHAAQTRNFLGYLASLHDIGKLGETFQERIRSHCPENIVRQMDAYNLNTVTGRDSVRHEVTSRLILRRNLWDTGTEPSLRKSRDLLANIIGAHHQGHTSRAHDYDPDSIWAPYWEELNNQMSNFFLEASPFQVPDIDKKDHAFLGAVLSGLLILADWIASGEVFDDAQTVLQQKNGIEAIRARAQEFVIQSHLAGPPFEIEDSFDAVLPALAGRARPLQHLIEDIFRKETEKVSLLLIEAPMGEGKTEAALYAASQMASRWGKNGVYFALPTAATANQMVNRVQSFLDGIAPDVNVRLLHSMAWLTETARPRVDEDALQAAVEWLKPLRRGLLGPWSVGTVDQAMMAAMFIKYGVLRLLGLMGKVLILDEVHAYDVYMTEILKALLEWCHELEIPVILLSATLPAGKKAELLSAYGLSGSESVYPGITYVRESGQLQIRALSDTLRRSPVTVRIHNFLHDAAKIAQLAVDLAQNDGCIGVMVNTVDQAQQVYGKIIELQGNDENVWLFHSRFLAARRREIEKNCVEAFAPTNMENAGNATRVKRGILVCTQVVEQSIDLDLDTLITSAAPIDLVLQRLGRMHRHQTTIRPAGLENPVLHLLVPKDIDWGADEAVYPACLLQQTRRILSAKDQIALPDDIPGLVEAGYSSDNIPENELKDWLEHTFQQEMQTAQGHNIALESPDKGFEPVRSAPLYSDLEDRGYLSAQTRLEKTTVRIALLNEELYARVNALSTKKGEVPVYDRKLAAAVMDHSVAVPAARLQDVQAPLTGAGLLSHVLLFPLENGAYTDPKNHIHILNDNQMGVSVIQ